MSRLVFFACSVALILCESQVQLDARTPAPLPQDYLAHPVAEADLVRWMTPIWRGDVMNDESIWVWGPANQAVTVPLLFDPTEILSVKDSSRTIDYQSGRDWKMEKSGLVFPPGSQVPWTLPEEMFPALAGPPKTTMPKLGGGFLLFREGPFIHQKQIVVTYRHAADAWKGPLPAFDPALLPRTLSRLKAGQPLKIVATGDSITQGYSSSFLSGVAPFMPSWVELTRLWLEHVYRAPVTALNKGVAGKTSAWGAQTAPAAFAGQKPDLVLIAFGMNDRTHIKPAQFASNLQTIMAAARAENPDVEFILVQSMQNNPDWEPIAPLAEFGAALRSLRGPGVGFVDMQAMDAFLLERKRYQDMTGNNVNHPNDFLIRIYAQTVSALLVDPAQLTPTPP